jgi:hypothetical protein
MAKWTLVSIHPFEFLTYLAAYRFNWLSFPFLLAFSLGILLLPSRAQEQIDVWFFGGLAGLGAVAVIAWPIARSIRRVKLARIYEEGSDGSKGAGWPKVRGVSVENGVLQITYAKGKMEDIPLYEIPNCHVIIGLFEKL